MVETRGRTAVLEPEAAERENTAPISEAYARPGRHTLRNTILGSLAGLMLLTGAGLAYAYSTRDSADRQRTEQSSGNNTRSTSRMQPEQNPVSIPLVNLDTPTPTSTPEPTIAAIVTPVGDIKITPAPDSSLVVDTPTISAPVVVSPVTRTVLGNEYQQRVAKAGYSQDVARRIASLPYNQRNITLADQLLLIGEKAGYARGELEKRLLPVIEDLDVSDEELVVVRDIDGDGVDNETEISKKSNLLDRFNRLPPTIDSLAVLNDELYVMVAGNDDLVYAFNLQNFRSLFRELRTETPITVKGEQNPYREVLKSLVKEADPKKNVSEAWNYKIRREDEVLFDILKLSPDNNEVWEFRWDNGSYHLQLWLNGDSLYSLDKEGMQVWFPKKEDREFEYKNRFWLPKAFGTVSVKSWRVQPEQKLDFSIMQENMDVLKGRHRINNLPYENLQMRITLPYKDRTVQSYFPSDKGYRFWEHMPDYQASQSFWDRQTTTTSEIRQVGEIWRKDYDPILAQYWEDYDLIRTAYGLAVIDMKLPESYDVRVASIYLKSLGGGMGESLGEYIANNINGRRAPVVHQVPTFQLPFSVIQHLPPTRIIEKGQSVFPYGDSRLGIRYHIFK